jgi:ABC-2 type transport system ATP-binding protein
MASAGPVVVSVSGLSKRFVVRRSWASLVRHPFRREMATVLSGITCEVRAGEFFGLLGPNGAGKTTFLKVLATLVLPDEGEVVVAGANVVREDAKVRDATSPCLATERSLLWRLTARENLRVYADLLGIDPVDVAARVEEALDAVELRDTGEKLVGQFSSGMMQRLLIARALLPRPKLLLLDEPTRSLDPVAAREFRAFLRRELVERRGCAVILATHNAEEALDLCDRVAVLHRGRMLSTGTAEELVHRYIGATYRIVTTEPDHPALRSLIDRGVLRLDERRGDARLDDGWHVVSVRLIEGEHHAADVLATLVGAGMRISRMEAVSPSLADLISSVVSHEAERTA